MPKILHAGCPAPSSAISLQFTLEGPLLPRFGDTATYWPKIATFPYPPII